MADNRGVPEQDSRPPQGEDRRRELNRRLRAVFIEGAEERSREAVGRGLTDEELRRIMRRYPGDLPGELDP
jgi:hypothetical protein